MEYICDIGMSNDDLIVRRSHVREKIVRCKDCKYFRENGGYMWCTHNGVHQFSVKPNCFCSWGEKKIMEKVINIETKYGVVPLNGDLIENEDGTYNYKLNVDWESVDLKEMAAKYIGLTD